MSFELKYREYKQSVEAGLEKLNFAHKDNPKLSGPLQYMIELGGKRLRPVMTLAACHSFGNNYDGAISPALGLEVFHNFSLIHDDIMDNAPLRRGKPTVHEKWGVNVGILSGDLMLIKSYELITAVAPHALPHVFRVFNRTAIEVCEGQQMDMDFESRDLVTEEEYIRMILLKTAVLLGASLQIGALIGGATEEDAEMLYEFGCEIGIAFQIKDDWLDSFGEGAKVGKRIGGDIVEGKKTLLMIRALEHADEAQKQQLKKAYNGVSGDDERIGLVKDVFEQLGISNACQLEIRKRYDKAIGCLEKVQIANDKKTFFREFAEFLIYRDF